MKFLLSFLVALSLLTSVAQADVKKGQKIFLKKMKSCKKDGVKNGIIFAHKHSQDEWRMFNSKALIKSTFKEICPSATKKIDKMKPKNIQHLTDFVIEYASDSGNVPSC